MTHRSMHATVMITGLFAATPLPAANVSGSFGLVSDYRYRGLSLSEGKPALQGELDVDAGHGAYGGIWASTIRDGGTTHTEFDLTMGDEIELRPGITLDLSGTYYAYPASPHDNYAEGTATIGAEHGALTGKLGISYAPPQRALRDDNGIRHGNSYTFAGAELAIPKQPLKLIAQTGYEHGAFDGVDRGGKWDWSIGLAAERGSARASLTYVDSNAGAGTIVGTLAIAF